MIKSFGNKETEKIFNQQFSKKLPYGDFYNVEIVDYH